jgi:hypothetical protein
MRLSNGWYLRKVEDDKPENANMWLEEPNHLLMRAPCVAGECPGCVLAHTVLPEMSLTIEAVARCDLCGHVYHLTHHVGFERVEIECVGQGEVRS